MKLSGTGSHGNELNVHQPSSRLKICIATIDIAGPIRNGGIGSAYYSLAVSLAAAGHDVTVLYGLGRHCEQGTIQQWKRYYAGLGVNLVPLPEPKDGQILANLVIRNSYSTYRWFKERDFDLVHFHEWQGIGFFTLLAKQQGLCLPGAKTVVGVHSPLLWAKEGMGELVSSVDEIEIDFMERESVAAADILWSPSRYMLGWLETKHWRLPREVVVKPNILTESSAGFPTPDPSLTQVDELIFFGRLETRKGLDIFCSALDQLAKPELPPFSVTFLGKVANVHGVPSDEYLDKRAARWNFPWRIVSDLDRTKALAYLAGPGRVAVLPSRLDNLPYTVLECVGLGIRFLAGEIGGIPEMVAPADRPRVLFPLKSYDLSPRLSAILRNGMTPAKPAFDLKESTAEWIRWHEALAGAPSKPVSRESASPAANPLVSVCITHHNRPQLLRQALKSLEKQTYPSLEVVLVDDSDSAEAKAAIARLAPAFRRRGWQLIRQPDRFVGAARNSAARHARGEFLMFMDDDNIAKENEVEVFVQASRGSAADVLVCFLDAFRGTRPPHRRTHPVHRWPFLGGSIAGNVFRNTLGDTNCFMRKRVFEAIGGFTEEEHIGFEDWELLSRAMLKGFRVQVVPEALVWFRQTGSGMASRHSSLRDHVRALRPYAEQLSPEIFPALQLAKNLYLGGLGVAGQTQSRIDAGPIQRVVIFGTGQGGKMAKRLADSFHWEIVRMVDNNEAVWGKTVEGIPVGRPADLTTRDFDLIIVSSTAGKPAIYKQLRKMGFEAERDFAFFMDRFVLNGLEVQLTLT